ncbi:hypothetical protein CHS0354_008473 [Potamilus streckersoni]|uniref:Uncharacterized protein n=1 Tax=Potamilus streckersoni TaxID=2493646 RepID=A0AAE0RPP5_9BIVA|nr:hypothetical protein CHS0354_008473 [Potamilus streckersoni]
MFQWMVDGPLGLSGRVAVRLVDQVPKSATGCVIIPTQHTMVLPASGTPKKAQPVTLFRVQNLCMADGATGTAGRLVPRAVIRDQSSVSGNVTTPSPETTGLPVKSIQWT